MTYNFGFIFALCSALFWALGNYIYKNISSEKNALILNFCKTTLALIIIAPLILTTSLQLTPTLNNLLLLLLSGLLGIGLGDTFFFKALALLRPLPLIIFMLLGQAFTVLLAIVFLQESISLIAAFGIFLIFSGVAWIRYPQHKNKHPKTTPKGFIYAFISCICMSISFILIKKISTSITPLTITALRFLGGFISLAPVIFCSAFSRKHFYKNMADPVFRKTLLLGVILSTLGGFITLHMALKYAPAFLVNTLVATEPMFIILLGIIFFHDKPRQQEIIGSVFCFLGVLFLQYA